MKNTFEIKHVGINMPSAEEARDLAAQLCSLFNLEPKHGNKSEFAGSLVECMKTPYLGTHGHIALVTDDLESAMAELKEKGCTFLEETASYREDGKLKNIYLQGEFGGFAIHIMQK